MKQLKRKNRKMVLIVGALAGILIIVFVFSNFRFNMADNKINSIGMELELIDGWEHREENNCYSNSGREDFHECLIIQKDGYKIVVFRFEDPEMKYAQTLDFSLESQDARAKQYDILQYKIFRSPIVKPYLPTGEKLLKLTFTTIENNQTIESDYLRIENYYYYIAFYLPKELDIGYGKYLQDTVLLNEMDLIVQTIRASN